MNAIISLTTLLFSLNLLAEIQLPPGTSIAWNGETITCVGGNPPPTWTCQSQCIARTDVMVVKHHGLITLSATDLADAFTKMEKKCDKLISGMGDSRIYAVLKTANGVTSGITNSCIKSN